MKHKTETKKQKKRKNPLHYLRWGAPLPIFLTAAIGIILLALPEGDSLAIPMGVLLVATGVPLLAGAFLSRKAELIQLLFGIVEIALSIWLFVDPARSLNALVYIFGGILLLRSLFGILGALTIQRADRNQWKIQFMGALIIAVFAIILLFNPFGFVQAMYLLVGIIMLFNASLELFSCIRGLFVKSKEREEKIAFKQEKKSRKKQEKGQEETSENE